MGCDSPVKGWRARRLNESGKRPIVFEAARGYLDMPVEVPCGKCKGCRLEHSRQWAVRCVHEAQLHKVNSFITLTYRDEDLPKNMSLDKSDFQLFMKRLRKEFVGTNPYDRKIDKKSFDDWQFENGIRYYMCGEYGEACFHCGRSRYLCAKGGCGRYKPWLGRPHYHALLFGLDFADKEALKKEDGHMYYTSEVLSNLWGKGYVIIGEVSFDSAAYVSRYVMKKINGALLNEVDPETGLKHYERLIGDEVVKVESEYANMSRRPGIAANWIEKFKSDVYPKDFVTVGGKKQKPPKYYDNKLDEIEAELLDAIKRLRKKRAEERAEEYTSQRLMDKAKVRDSKLNLKKRRL